MSIKNNVLHADWNVPNPIRALTTTRVGGISKPPFDTMNLALHVNDAPADVQKNRGLLLTQLQLPHEPRWLNQVHGTHAIDITHATDINADACYTQNKNTVCAVMTADCLPILICNTQGSEVAAIHAGWRGLLNGVINNTIQSLQSKPKELLAWLGPAISTAHFAVSEEIVIAFSERDSHNKACFKQDDNQQWYADLYALAKNTLQQLGLAHISGGDYCTYRDADWFYSYRRDNKTTGRMASLIWIEDKKNNF